jgi:hypothetical protein
MATLAGVLVADRTSEFDAGVALLLQDTPDEGGVRVAFMGLVGDVRRAAIGAHPRALPARPRSSESLRRPAGDPC